MEARRNGHLDFLLENHSLPHKTAELVQRKPRQAWGSCQAGGFPALLLTGHSHVTYFLCTWLLFLSGPWMDELHSLSAV
ncbi:unnamed protein product [Caretta caretta]